MEFPCCDKMPKATPVVGLVGGSLTRSVGLTDFHFVVGVYDISGSKNASNLSL